MLGGDDTPVEEIQKAAAAISQQTKSYNRRQLRHMEEFEAIFKEVIALLPKGPGRLVIFVDDLDRCLPEKAIEILEAIKLFLEVPGVVFVLGMDQGVIRQGIDTRYAAAFRRSDDQERGELPIQGDSYLQKIVQIPFHLPALAMEDMADFIADLNPQLSEMTRAVLAHGIYPNPRQVKRVLNILRLLRGVANRRFRDKAVIADPLLAKTVIIQSQYPKLYQLWRQYPTLVQTLEAEYARRPTSEEDVLMGIRRTATRRAAKQDKGAGGGTEDAVAEPVLARGDSEDSGRSGLLLPYLNDRARYALLARLMSYPPEAKPGIGVDRARFSGLTRQQVEVYVRLAGTVTVESDPVPVDVSTDWMSDLLSGDVVKIRDVAGMLAGEEADKDGPLHQAVRQQLVTVLSDPQQPTRRRLRAGDALAHIGDPRFHGEDGFHLPNDEMLGFVAIPAGQFRMGSDPQLDPEAEEDEQPQHSLHLPQFYMARYPVTVAQFKLFVARTGHEPDDDNSLQGLDNHPVRSVSWDDALDYCKWLNDVLRGWDGTPPTLRLNEGWSVTLPSEAEWEKAARGTDGRIYPWGNEFDQDKANHKDTGLETTSTVGCFPDGASSFGLLDMSGNVWEWTRTLWGKWDDKASNFDAAFSYPYKPEDGREALEMDSGWARVLRGSSYCNEASYTRCSFRDGDSSDGDLMDLGFRISLSPFPF